MFCLVCVFFGLIFIFEDDIIFLLIFILGWFVEFKIICISIFIVFDKEMVNCKLVWFGYIVFKLFYVYVWISLLGIFFINSVLMN